MSRYRVWYSVTNYWYTDVEAESEEEAQNIAENEECEMTEDEYNMGSLLFDSVEKLEEED